MRMASRAGLGSACFYTMLLHDALCACCVSYVYWALAMPVGISDSVGPLACFSVLNFYLDSLHLLLGFRAKPRVRISRSSAEVPQDLTLRDVRPTFRAPQHLATGHTAEPI